MPWALAGLSSFQPKLRINVARRDFEHTGRVIKKTRRGQSVLEYDMLQAKFWLPLEAASLDDDLVEPDAAAPPTEEAAAGDGVPASGEAKEEAKEEANADAKEEAKEDAKEEAKEDTKEKAKEPEPAKEEAAGGDAKQADGGEQAAENTEAASSKKTRVSARVGGALLPCLQPHMCLVCGTTVGGRGWCGYTGCCPKLSRACPPHARTHARAYPFLPFVVSRRPAPTSATPRRPALSTSSSAPRPRLVSGRSPS